MRTLIAALVLGLLLACGTTVLAAKEDKKLDKKKKRDSGKPRFDAKKFIKDHDKNNDNKLSREELPKKLRDGFKQIDRNKDGKLDSKELQRHASRMVRRRPRIVEVVYFAIDAPRSPKITLKELQEAYEVLRKLDKDGDGKLEEKDIRAFHKERLTKRIDTMIKNLDNNDDGKISKDEARGMLVDRFKKLDSNNDDFLDKQELHAALMPKGKSARKDKEK